MTSNTLLENFSNTLHIKKGLYIVATPIGNKHDITIRAIKVLEKSDTILCEDTRVTKNLFKIIGITTHKKNWLTYNDHSSDITKNYIIDKLITDKIVSLVSDAGTPLISDPGYKLINIARERGYDIYSIPGPCAAIASLALSALKTDKFCFLGFLPKNKNDYVSVLRDYSIFKSSLILYEKPSRLKFLFKTIEENFESFKLVIVKELTKFYESIFFLYPENIKKFLKDNKNLKGELTIILEVSNSIKKVYSNKELITELKKLKPSQVSAMLSKNSSESRQDIYKRCMNILHDKYNQK